MWKKVVALLFGVAVVAVVASIVSKPEAVAPPPPAVVVAKRLVQFSTGNYVVAVESGPVGSNVIAADTYYSNGSDLNKRNNFCLYRVTRGGAFVAGSFFVPNTKVYQFTVQVGDVVEIQDCTWYQAS